MKELSPLAKQLVASGRALHKPTAADKLRVREALGQQLPLAPPQPPPGDPSLPPAAPPWAPWTFVAAASAGAAVVAGALYWGLATNSEPGRAQPSPPTVVRAPKVRAPEPASAPDAEKSPEAKAAPAEAPAERQAVHEAPKVSGKAREEAQRKNRLAEEVALLSKATSALGSGRARDALRALAEHERRFPRGLLSVERRAARAQALCMLGRKAEAERELAHLSPSSPQAVRARELCRGK